MKRIPFALLATAAFVCLSSLIPVSAAVTRAAEPEVVYLWDGVAPGSEGQTGEEIMRLSDSGERIVSNVHRPSLTVYLPVATTATVPAVLVVPGGGHREIWTDHEGHNVARWLSERGVAAFILKYRLPRQEGSPYAIEHEVADGQRALRIMRHRAAQWRIDPARIGMIGFSAGGELVARVAVAADAGDPDAGDPIERQSARPAFQALMYPAHPELIQPTADAPPAFLSWGFEDFPMIADGMGGVYARFRAVKVPVEMHVYSNAGHGFGLRAKDCSPAGQWINRFHEWLGSRGLLRSQEFIHHDDPRVVGADAAAIARMDALLQSFVDDQKLNSVVGFVAKGGNVVYKKAFGWKDLENRIPAAVDDYYVLFSQSKAITTVAFMTLVEQGLVAIDDPVAKYFPEIPDRVVTKVNEDGTYETRPAGSPVTFLHLITHTSGLGAGLVRDIRRAERKDDGGPMGFGGAVPAKTPSGQHSGGGNPDSRFLEEEMRALAKYPLGFDPGTKWNYHVSTNMLGYLIERISGKPLRQYVKQAVLDPLGMDETDWYYAPEARDRFVKPYRVVEGKLQPGPTLYSDGAVSGQQTYAEGAIGLNGPITDYAKFCQMLLNQGEFNGRRILKPETIRLMTTINRLPADSGAAKDFQFGLGFELHRVKKPVAAVSDSAFAFGGMFGTAYLIDPENDLIALFYMNMYNAEPMFSHFLEQAYRLFDGADGANLSKP